MQEQNSYAGSKIFGLFSKTINFFKKSSIDIKKEITEALLFRKTEKALSLINEYAKTHTDKELYLFLNTPNQYGDTLLETSLSSQQYDCSALLLELGADPNKLLKNGEWRIRLHIKSSLGGGDPTIYLLLSLYGASIEGITPNNTTAKANKIMQTHIDRVKNEYQPLGLERIQLIRSAEEAVKQYRYQEAANAYENVAEVWNKAYTLEKRSKGLKEFYNQQSIACRMKGVELKQTHLVSGKENSPSPVSSLHHRNDEQRRLTASPSKYY